MDPLRVMLIDRPGFGHDVLEGLLASLPSTRLVGEDPDVVVVDDRSFTTALPLLAAGVPTIVLGVDDDPGYAERASRHGAVAWLPKESVSTELPELLADELVTT